MSFIDDVGDFFSGIGDKLSDIGKSIGDAFSDFGTAVSSFIGNIGQNVDDFVNSVGEGIGNFINGAVRWAVENIFNPIGNTLSELFEGSLRADPLSLEKQAIASAQSSKRKHDSPV